jgi:hypothetical protein
MFMLLKCEVHRICWQRSRLWPILIEDYHLLEKIGGGPYYPLEWGFKG